jgi:hypothetical protein
VIAQYEAALCLRPNWGEVADHLARLYQVRDAAAREVRGR